MSDVEKFEVSGEWIVEVRKIDVKERYRYPDRKTRVYVSDDVLTGERWVELHDAEENLGERRFATRGQFPDVDRLYDRLNREIMRQKRNVALYAVEQALGLEDVTGRFSRHAGCSCACSPGVVLDRQIRRDGVAVDIWVEKA